MSITRFLFVAGAVALSASGAFAQSVIYRENFGTNTDQKPISTVGWITYTGNAAANAVLANNAQSSLGLVVGKPNDLANVNAGTSDSVVNGVGFVASGNGTNDLLSYTTEYVIDRGAYDQISFTWWAASRYALDTQRIALQVDNVWYASANQIVPPGIGPGANFNSLAQQFTTNFTTVGSDWLRINFTPGSPLTLGSAAGTPLLGGNITAFGLYIELGNQANVTDEASRFDTFTVLARPVNVSAAPEPSALALMATGILPGITLQRYRRRRSA